MCSSWDELDEYLQLVSLVAYEVERIKKAHFQLINLVQMFNEHLDLVNIAPAFFSEALDALEYKVIVGTVRLYNKGSASLMKLLCKAENRRPLNSNLHKFVLERKKRLEEIDILINPLETARDHYLAHLDQRAFDGVDPEINFWNSELNENIVALLDFAKSTLSGIFTHCGKSLPPEFPLYCDLQKLIDKMKI